MPLSIAGANVNEKYSSAMEKFESGDALGAEAMLREVIHFDPRHGDALNDLGVILFQKGELHEAASLLRRAASVSREPLEPVRNLSEVEISLGNYAQAEAMLLKLVNNAAADTAVFVRLAECAARRGAEEDAQLWQTKAAEFQRSGASPKVSAVIEIDSEKLRDWELKVWDESKRLAEKAAEVMPFGGVLVDVGANVGVFAAQLVTERTCGAYLFEPLPELYEYCRQRFEGISTITVEPFALSDTAGSAEFFSGSENLGWNTLFKERADDAGSKITVPAITFDEYASQRSISRIDVINIDAEGSEYKILRGMRKTLSALEKKPVIFCKFCWSQNSQLHWNELEDAVEWLFASGYRRIDYKVDQTTVLMFVPDGPPATP